MKNKGFTLVELLAVIVILAVISIITIPMIGNVIEESKKKSLEQSVNGLVEAARYYSIENDGTYEFLFDENKKGETINGDSLDYRGSINAEGKLYLDQDGNISICVYNDKYYAYKNYNSGIVIGNRSEDNCDIGYDVISNKYIAFLESEGISSNIYSKDEVNNLIGNVESKVTNNTNEITNIKSTIETLQNNLNSYALQSSLNTTNSNLNNLSSVVGSHTEAIDNLSSNVTSLSNKIQWKKIAETTSTTEIDVDFNPNDYNEILLVALRNDDAWVLGSTISPIELYNIYTKDGIVVEHNNISVCVFKKTSDTKASLKVNSASTYTNKTIVFAR